MEIKKEPDEIENKKNLSKLEKEEIDEYLTKLVRILDKNEKNCYYGRDDPDYYGIRDIENLFDKVDEEDYYKPILVKSSCGSNYKYYESRGDRNKSLSVKQYPHMIIPYLRDIINDHKATEKAWKIQITMRVHFISSKDTGETRTIYVLSDTEDIMEGWAGGGVVKQIILLKNFLNLF